MDNASDFDLEAQSWTTTGSSHSSQPLVPPKPVGLNMSETAVKQFRKEYGFAPILRSSEEFSLHPHLAWGRNSLEKLALKRIDREFGREVLIADVGSAARAVRMKNIKVHCICPNLQSGDAARLSAIKRVPGAKDKVCTHTLQTCTCGPFDVLLFTHSAYYFSWEDLKQALSKTSTKVGFVVGHLFPEAFGQFAYGEGQYEYVRRDGYIRVVTKAVGNTHAYEHEPLLWDFGREVGDRESSLDVEIVAKSLDTYLFRVQLTERPVSRKVYSSWVDQVVDESHQGPITIPGNDLVTRASRAANAVLELEVDHLYGFGPICYTISERGFVFVPRGAVVEAASRIAYKQRDPATFQDVAHVIRNAVSVSRLPDNHRLGAVTLGTALAFTMNVVNETDAMHTITSRFSKRWNQLNTLLHLVPIATWSIYSISFVLCILFLIALSTFAIPYDDHLIGIVVVSVFVVFLFFVCCGFWCKRRYERRQIDTWAQTLFVEGRATNVDPGVRPLGQSMFPPNHTLVEPLLPAEGTTMNVGTDRAVPKHPGKTPIAIRAGGTVFSTATPSVTADTQAAEVVALTHRVLMPPTTVMPTALGRYCIWEDTPAGRALMKVRIARMPDEFEGWVSQPKFTQSIKDKFRKLRQRWEGKYVGSKVYRSFVKVEKNKTHTVEGAPKLKPRLIQGPPDEVKVMLGPIISKIYKAVREAWSGGESQVVYCSGLTPDEIGRHCDTFAEANGGWGNMTAYWSDCRRFDSTAENEVQKPVQDMYRRMGMTDVEYHWLKCTRNGVTKHGVKYGFGDKNVMNVDGTTTREPRVQINSGEMDTNLKGTVINCQAHQSGLPPMRYLMLVCGDDIFILFVKAEFTLKVRDDLVQHVKDLGLDVEWGASDRRGDWEFCSKLFWWGELGGREYTVLAPKVGRLLSRVGWNLTKPGSENFRATLLGLKDDVFHVPLLNRYVDVHLAVTSGMKAVGKPEWTEMKHVSRRFNPTPLNMGILAERYGLTRQHVDEFAILLARVRAGEPNVISYPWIEGMVKRDEA